MKQFLILCQCILFLLPELFAQPSCNWANRMGGMDHDAGTSLDIDAQGNVYLTGFFGFTVDFDPGPGTNNLTSTGGSDIFITKMDASGNLSWAKQIGGINPDVGNSLTLDMVGNIYVTGYFMGIVDFDPGADTLNLTSAGANDIFIIKLDTSGNLVWAKQIGGPGIDVGNSLTVDATGSVYITGYFEDSADFDPGAGVYNLYSVGSYDIFITKLDSSGDLIWAKQIGSASNDEGNSVTLDTEDNVYVTGGFKLTADFDPNSGTYNMFTAGGVDVFVTKLDASGNFLWAKQMGGAEHDWGYSLIIGAGGDLYFTGSFGSMVDFDPGSGTYNLTSAGGMDIFVSKLDSSGNFIWAQQMGGIGNDVGISHYLNSTGEVLITGYFENTADFDPGPNTSNLTSEGGKDIFVTKLDVSGNFMWAKQIGGTDSDAGYSIATDLTGNIFSTGWFSDTAQFIPDAGTCNLAAVEFGLRDVFVVQFGNISGISSKLYSESINIYPNPTTGRFTLEMDMQEKTNLSIKLYHFTGQLMHSEVIGTVIGNYSQKMDFSWYAKGMYYVQIMTKEGVITRKVIYQ